MRPEHVEANQLLDVFATGDREVARATMEEMSERLPEHVYRQAVHLANWQYQMYERYTRLFAWRVEWKGLKNRKAE